MFDSSSLISDLMEATAISATQEKLVRSVATRMYYELCKMAPFAELRTTHSLTVTSSGTLIPATILGIMSVRDSNDDEYFQTDEADLRDSSDARMRWYKSGVSMTAGSTARVELTPGSQTVTPALTTHAGLVMKVDGEPAMYEVESDGTLNIPYAGERMQSTDVTITPAGTPKMYLLDENGSLEGATVTLYCWKLPPPLTLKDSMIMLPETSALFFRSLMRLKTFRRSQIDEKRNFGDDLRKAEATLLSMVPAYHSALTMDSELRSGATAYPWGND